MVLLTIQSRYVVPVDFLTTQYKALKGTSQWIIKTSVVLPHRFMYAVFEL